ncbi:MAG: mechanosensitive ion channel family protein [Bacteroidota bacterium]
MNFNLQKAIDILSNKLEEWLESTTAMLPNMFIAMLVMITFYFIARVIKSVSSNILNRFSEKKALNNLFTTFAYLGVLGVGLIISLNILHLEQTVSSLLAGAGIVGLALGFAFQDITANFISGVFIAFRKPIQVGDIIETGSYMGLVEEINLRVTVIRTFQGLHVIIPNKDIFQSAVTNYTKTDDRRIDLEVGVSYADNLEQVKEITIKAVSKIPNLMPGREIELYYNAFGDSSINFILMIWIHYPNEAVYLIGNGMVMLLASKACLMAMMASLFAFRTLDFGIKGGQTLSEMKT